MPYSATLGLDSVANGDYGIETVEHNWPLGGKGANNVSSVLRGGRQCPEKTLDRINGMRDNQKQN